MGNVRRHGKGWQLIYQVGGQRYWETVRVENESEAVRILKIREGEAAAGRKPPEAGHRLRFEDLAARLEANYQVVGRRDLKSLPGRLAHLRAFFGGWRAVKITTPAVERYAAHRRQQGAAPATVNRELSALRRMFTLAVQAEELHKCPGIPRLREAAPRRGFFEPGQFYKLLVELPDHLRPLAEFAYFTGWRREEITALRWDQVDLASRTVRLWPGTTKNDEGRALPLEGRLLELLRRQAKQRVNGCPWVFHSRGRRILTFYKAWKEACRKAECPGMLFHDLRRTAARNFRRAGLSEAEAMAITGHKTTAIFRRYSIIAESDLRDAVWRSQAFLAPAGEEECAKSVPALS